MGTQSIAPFSLGLSLGVSYPFLWLSLLAHLKALVPSSPSTSVFYFQLPPGNFHHPYFLPLPKLNIFPFLPCPLSFGAFPCPWDTSVPLRLKSWSSATFSFPLGPLFIYCLDIFRFLWALPLPLSLFDNHFNLHLYCQRSHGSSTFFSESCWSGWQRKFDNLGSPVSPSPCVRTPVNDQIPRFWSLS